MIGEIMKKINVATRAGAIAILAMGFITPAQAADNPVKLIAPKEIADVPAIPFTGIKAQTFATPSSMINLDVTPSQVVIGDAMTITGKGLTGNTPVTLTWSTNDATWVTDVQPNTVNYMGTAYTKYNVVIATVTTDPLGGFVYKTKVPSDFGGVHDIYAVNNETALAHGGVQIARTFKMTPTSGPVGTPITIEYSGLGPSLYAAGSALYYDNKFVGEMQARWTRGTARTTILASGAVGKHFIQANDGVWERVFANSSRFQLVCIFRALKVVFRKLVGESFNVTLKVFANDWQDSLLFKRAVIVFSGVEWHSFYYKLWKH